MNNELLNCPFCGFKPDASDVDMIYPNGSFWTEDEHGRSYMSRKDTSRFPDSKPCYSMNCVGLAGGCGVEMSGDSIDEVIEKWSRRIP